jgi:hypothetical protein
MGKLTMSMAIFNRKVLNYKGHPDGNTYLIGEQNTSFQSYPHASPKT